jgi:hypothetical protein
MDHDTLLGAVRPWIVRHRRGFRELAAALVTMATAEHISAHPDASPGAVKHLYNHRLKEEFGPVEDRTEQQNLRAVARMLIECENLSMELTDENVHAIIERVLGDPLTPNERKILEDL